MKNSKSANRTKPPKKLSFKTKLERIAKGMDYFAVSVPEKVTRALKTTGPVPIAGQINDSETFIASLYPVGGGRHYLRVRNKICKSVGIKPGDSVRVKITVRDRNADAAIPHDLMKALREEDVTDAFKALPIGKRGFLIRLINQAAKPETRAKRIQDAVEAALYAFRNRSDLRQT